MKMNIKTGTMKTIEVTDEMYKFLEELSTELNTQNHRCTAMPYFFQVQTKNAFLTEKACKEHIKLNKHHYNEPADYLMHAFRNPELEKLMEFICGITKGKLHK